MKPVKLDQHIIEIVSDAGEGAQKAGTIFARASAKMGNGLWTVEIIPSEIQPPPHTVRSSSGIRIRFGDRLITNAGDQTDLIFCFNETSLESRILADSLKPGVMILIDDSWSQVDDPKIVEHYHELLEKMKAQGARIVEVPLTVETKRIAEDAEKGKNMFVLGLLSAIYVRDMQIVKELISETFEKKDPNK